MVLEIKLYYISCLANEFVYKSIRSSGTASLDAREGVATSTAAV
jgi:hypothetical protein